MVERSFAHLYETGGLRRVWVRGHLRTVLGEGGRLPLAGAPGRVELLLEPLALLLPTVAVFPQSGIAWPVERGSPQSVLPNCPDCKAQGSLTPAPDYTESGGAVRCSNCDSRFGYPAEGAKTDLTLMNEPSGPDQAWVLQHNRSPKGIGPTVDAAIADAEKRFGEGLFAARRENRTELLSVDRKSGQELEDAWNALENLVLSDAGASIAAHFDTRTPPVLIPIEIEDLEKLTRDIETMKGRQAGASRRSRSSTGPRRSSGPHKGGDVQQQADLQVHPAHSGMRRS